MNPNPNNLDNLDHPISTPVDSKEDTTSTALYSEQQILDLDFKVEGENGDNDDPSSPASPSSSSSSLQERKKNVDSDEHDENEEKKEKKNHNGDRFITVRPFERSNVRGPILADEKGVGLYVPVISGESIGLDNTCKSLLEILGFFGFKEGVTSAPREIANYIRDLELDIKLFQLSNDSSPAVQQLVAQKLARLAQAKHYQQLFNELGNQHGVSDGVGYNFPAAIQGLVAKGRGNCVSISLSPRSEDTATSLDSKGALFSVTRADHGHGGHSSNGLGFELRRMLADEQKTHLAERLEERKAQSSKLGITRDALKKYAAEKQNQHKDLRVNIIEVALQKYSAAKNGSTTVNTEEELELLKQCIIDAHQWVIGSSEHKEDEKVADSGSESAHNWDVSKGSLKKDSDDPTPTIIDLAGRFGKENPQASNPNLSAKGIVEYILNETVNDEKDLTRLKELIVGTHQEYCTRLLPEVKSKGLDLSKDLSQAEKPKPGKPLPPLSSLDMEYLGGYIYATGPGSLASTFASIVVGAATGEVDFAPLDVRSPFDEPALVESKSDDKESCSLRCQLFLAIINAYCYEKGYSDSNFGRVIEGKAALLQKLVDQVQDAINNKTSIENTILNIVNEGTGGLFANPFGLKRTLSAEDAGVIKKRFAEQHHAVKGSPHFDEFLLLVPTKAGRVGPFYSISAKIAVPFEKFIAATGEQKAHKNLRKLHKKYFESSGSTPALLPTTPELKDHVIAKRELGTDFSFEVNLSELLRGTADPSDFLARVLTDQVEGGGKKVIFDKQSITEDDQLALQQSRWWPNIKAKVVKEFSETELVTLASWESSSSSADITTLVSPDMEEFIYSKVMKITKNDQALVGYSGPAKLERAFRYLSETKASGFTPIQAYPKTCVPSNLGGHLMTFKAADKDAIAQLVAEYTKTKLHLYMPRLMARSIYSETVRQGRIVPNLNEHPDYYSTDKARMKGLLVRLGCDPSIIVNWEGENGYNIIATSIQDIDRIKNIYNGYLRSPAVCTIALYEDEIRKLCDEGKKHVPIEQLPQQLMSQFHLGRLDVLVASMDIVDPGADSKDPVDPDDLTKKPYIRVVLEDDRGSPRRKQGLSAIATMLNTPGWQYGAKRGEQHDWKTLTTQQSALVNKFYEHRGVESPYGAYTPIPISSAAVGGMPGPGTVKLIAKAPKSAPQELKDHKEEKDHKEDKEKDDPTSGQGTLIDVETIVGTGGSGSPHSPGSNPHGQEFNQSDLLLGGPGSGLSDSLPVEGAPTDAKESEAERQARVRKFVVSRIAMFLAVSAITFSNLGMMLAETPDLSALTWTCYATHWSLVLIFVHQSLELFRVIQAWAKKGDSTENILAVKDQDQYAKWRTVGLNFSIVVTSFYWALVYDPTINGAPYLHMLTHGLPALLYIITTMVNCLEKPPAKSACEAIKNNSYLPGLAVALTYVAFTVVYEFLGGEPVYAVMNWQQNPLEAGLYSGAGVAAMLLVTLLTGLGIHFLQNCKSTPAPANVNAHAAGGFQAFIPPPSSTTGVGATGSSAQLLSLDGSLDQNGTGASTNGQPIVLGAA